MSLVRVRINPDLFLNTDAIESIEFGVTRRDKQPGCRVRTKANAEHYISESAADWLLEMCEANSAYNGEVEHADAPLASRVAQLLRDTWRGVTPEQFSQLLNTGKPDDPIITDTMIADALTRLQTERVLVCLDGGRWYHASSAEAQAWQRQQAKPATDPLSVDEAPQDEPPNHSAHSAR